MEHPYKRQRLSNLAAMDINGLNKRGVTTLSLTDDVFSTVYVALESADGGSPVTIPASIAVPLLEISSLVPVDGGFGAPTAAAGAGATDGQSPFPNPALSTQSASATVALVPLAGASSFTSDIGASSNPTATTALLSATSGTASLNSSPISGTQSYPIGGAATSDPTSGRARSSSTAASATGNSNGNTPVVAGAVVGSVGAVTVMLLVLVILIRFYRQRSRSLRYTESNESASNLHQRTTPENPQPDPAMSQRRRSLVPPVVTDVFRRFSTHENRASSPTVPEEPRGFQKIAGRKMPSPFTPSAVEGPVNRHFDHVDDGNNRNMSEQSFYRDQDSDGSNNRDEIMHSPDFFSSARLDPEERNSRNPRNSRHSRNSRNSQTSQSEYFSRNSETLMPSPARTPNIHPGVEKYEIPRKPIGLEASPGPATPTLGRSHPSANGSRNSRFNEDV